MAIDWRHGNIYLDKASFTEAQVERIAQVLETINTTGFGKDYRRGNRRWLREIARLE